MTIGLREEIVDGYVVSIEQDKYSTTFRVEACRMINENMAGFPETSIVYATMKEANRRFNYLKRKIKRDGYACSR